ncbi:MAG TPA: hypothetical protein DIC56_21870 [Rhizobium sp.]|nr:hypothetical protein [Rhizobium sp.]
MTYDPNLNRDRPDLATPPAQAPRSGNWTWAAIGAVVLLAIAAWVMMSGPTTDPATTTLTPPAATDTAPAQPAAPTTSATPPATDAAPATPGADTTKP